MRTFFLGAIFVLVACTSTSRTTYEIIPPVSMDGRRCANQCLDTKQRCETSCRQETASCQNLHMIGSWVGEVFNVSSQSQRDIAKVCGADACMNSCVSNYNICHVNCGGKVIPHAQ